ncbi:peptide chain release factor N(5)-glutamine methyltransferase [Gracilimonas sp. Q87]|uniref:peptide chain release factor N(5)-glutamine methyltransferase n=1 Tax=Gracilimonas sp. Q87 TaxID=3384766 RepID=UPI003983F261
MAKTPSLWTVLSMLEWATDFFEEKEVRSPRYSIEWLLADVLNVKRLDLYLMYDRPLSSEELDTLRPLVKRRSLHEPLQYISGESDFLNVKIKVEPGVLIPRQETEQLVDLILKENKEKENLKILDIGTGSGCIPVSIKKEKPEWDVYATDISEKALEIAKSNAEYNEVEVTYFCDDLFEPSQIQSDFFDVIVSNPPYIEPDEKSTLDKEVLEFEPELALFCESTENMYSALESISRLSLKEKGTAYFELHHQLGTEVSKLFDPSIWTSEILKDLDEKKRFFKAKKA